MYPFIFISIALHLVSFLCIVLIFLKQKGSEVRDEVASTMASYIEQLEEENDRLMTRVKSYVEKRETQLDTRLRVLEQSGKAYRKSNLRNLSLSLILLLKIERNQKALQLYHQGFGVQDIARVLNCGVGEVELIVNMNDRSAQR